MSKSNFSAVVCADLDGTLVDGAGKIHPRDITLLHAFNEVCFVPATGRILDSVRRVFSRSGVIREEKIPFPLVLQNGSVTYRSGEVLQDYYAYPPQIQDRLIEIGRSLPELTILFSDADKMVMLSPNAFGIATADRYDLPSDPFDPARISRYCKMMCLSDHPALLREVERLTAGMDVERVYSMPSILEITPQGTSKGAGVKNLLAALGLAGIPVYAVGDGGNDVRMFEAADRSFAPITSPAEIQALVDQVVDPRPEGILTPVLRAVGFSV